MLSGRRDTGAAYRFLRKALRAVSDYPPSSITTDKLASYPRAILRLQNEGLLPNDVVHRTSKYLNNIFEADHGAQARDPSNARLSDDENRRSDPDGF
jgi:transposase-like protein